MGFFSEVFSPGQLILITATMRAGKSNVANYIIEQAIPLGYDIYTNILYFDYDEIEEAIKEGILTQNKDWYRRVPPEIHTVSKASELILGLFRTKKNITILDESLLFASGKKGVSKDIRWFEGLVTQIGKLDSSMGLIAQAKSKLATLLKQDLPSIEIKMHKISFSNRYCEIWFNPPQSSEEAEDSYKLDEWRNIPASRYPYDHKAPAGFEWDINMEAFINKISKLNSLKTRKQVPKIIAEMLEKKNQKPVKTSKKDLIKSEFYNNTKLTLRGLANKYKTSYQNIKNIHADFLRENPNLSK